MYNVHFYKALKLSNTNSEGYSSGKILNLLSNDGSRIEQSFHYVAYLVIAPLETIAIILLLSKYVDITILCGILLLIVSIPLQTYLGKVLNNFK